jgi:THO complex subunit 5
MEVETSAIPDTATSTEMNVSAQLKTAHNTRLQASNEILAKKINELVEYQIAHPQTKDATSRANIEQEKKVQRELDKRERAIRSQLSLMKALYRQSVFEVRKEKGLTKESRDVNDTLILQLHNLKYEEQSLGSEISAAQNYEYAVFTPYITTSLTCVLATST